MRWMIRFDSIVDASASIVGLKKIIRFFSRRSFKRAGKSYYNAYTG